MNSRIFRAICALTIFFAAALSLTSCDNDGASLIISSDTYVIEAGEKIDVEKLRQMFLTDTEAPPDTMEAPVVAVPDDMSAEHTNNGTDDETAYTVYWVKSGEVWHTKSTCSSLSRSKSILSGTVQEAMLAGKTRVCKRCGG